MCLSDVVFWISRDHYPEVELLGHVAGPRQFLEGAAHGFPSRGQCTRLPFSPRPRLLPRRGFNGHFLPAVDVMLPFRGSSPVITCETPTYLTVLSTFKSWVVRHLVIELYSARKSSVRSVYVLMLFLPIYDLSSHFLKCL